MKLRKVLIAGGIIFVAYNVGKLAGGIQCLKNVMEKYSTVNLDDASELVCKVGKYSTIIVTNKK